METSSITRKYSSFGQCVSDKPEVQVGRCYIVGIGAVATGGVKRAFRSFRVLKLCTSRHDDVRPCNLSGTKRLRPDFDLKKLALLRQLGRR